MKLESLLMENYAQKERADLRASLESMATEIETARFRTGVVEKRFQKFTGWLLFLSDLHLPFARFDLLDKIFDTEKKVDLIVLGGDILGFDDLSHFRKLREPTFNLEIAQAKALFPLIRKVWKKAPIVYLITNHEHRFHNKLMDLLDNKQVTEFLTELSYDFLRKDVHDLELVNQWHFRVGDTVLGHRETKTGVPGRHVTSFIDWLLPRVDFELAAVFQAHSHRQQLMTWKGVRGLESGMLCKVLPWTRERQGVTYADLWYCGYGKAYFENGRVEVNSIQPILLDTERL